MDAIKKKMQGMKLEKDNAMDRALLCEQQARDANARAEKASILAEEEARALQKKIQTIENDLDQTQEALMQVNAKLEEKDKALQNVSTLCYTRLSKIEQVPTSISTRNKTYEKIRKLAGSEMVLAPLVGASSVCRSRASSRI
ncbi:tropomyosin 1 isoform B, partial [Vespula squamosa]